MRKIVQPQMPCGQCCSCQHIAQKSTPASKVVVSKLANNSPYGAGKKYDAHM